MADETNVPDERLVEVAHQMFDLARAGNGSSSRRTSRLVFRST
jgi:hypothetical protein